MRDGLPRRAKQLDEQDRKDERTGGHEKIVQGTGDSFQADGAVIFTFIY